MFFDVYKLISVSIFLKNNTKRNYINSSRFKHFFVVVFPPLSITLYCDFNLSLLTKPEPSLTLLTSWLYSVSILPT